MDLTQLFTALKIGATLAALAKKLGREIAQLSSQAVRAALSERPNIAFIEDTRDQLKAWGAKRRDLRPLDTLIDQLEHSAPRRKARPTRRRAAGGTGAGRRVMAAKRRTAKPRKRKAIGRAKLSGRQKPKRIVFVESVGRSPAGKADYRRCKALAREALRG